MIATTDPIAPIKRMYDPNTIEQVFESFAGKRILVIGDVMIDSYLWGKVERISPEAPVPIVSLHRREYRLGGAANVALNIQNLGGIPVLCGITGQDEKGALFLRLLKEKNLEPNGIIASKERITTVKFRIIGNNTQMLRVDEEDDRPLQPQEIKLVLKRVEALVEEGRPDAIVFEDYDKGLIDPGLIRSVLALAKRRGIPVAADPKKKNFMAYKGVSLFKPNLKELREGLKLDGKLETREDIRAAVQGLQDKLEPGIIMATLSDKGIYYSQRDGVTTDGFFPGHVRNIADVSGAGDTVISVAVLSLAGGVETGLMTALCNLAGGLVCEYVGVVPVNKQAFKEEALRLLC